MIRREVEFKRLVAVAIEHHNGGRLADAEAAYLAALKVKPHHAAVLHNLGVLSASRRDFRSALDQFDASIAAEPRYASAHYNRAAALQTLGRHEEAIRGYSRAVVIEPEHYASHRALSFLHLAQSRRGRALDHFARTYELRRGEDRSGMAAPSLNSATKTKLLHDAELFRHLEGRSRDGPHFELMARNYEAVARDIPDVMTRLSEADLKALGHDYNTAIHVASAPEIEGGAVRERGDASAITEQFRAGSVGAVQVDELLTPRALSALKRYLLESTIWHDFSHIGGFVASYIEDGLACPLVLQIADEVRATFPDLLGKHPLTQGWAFKGMRPSSAVDIHADDAAISLNFWVTPNSANLNPEHGGLAVCRLSPPADWVIEDYDEDQARIVSFLERNASGTLTIGYAENRAVLFQSHLFHHSDSPKFAEGYLNHRINITLLFGNKQS